MLERNVLSLSRLAREAIALPVLFLLLLAPASISAMPAAQASASGVWGGTLEVNGQKLDITVTLQEGSGSWTGLISIPAQGTRDFPLTDIAVASGTVSFAMAGVPGDPVFRGTWDADAETIAGNLEQAGQSFPFTVKRTGDAPPIEASAGDPEAAAKLAGTWSGALSTGAQSLRLVFHLQAGADGALSGTMDSPDQGQTGLPLNKIAFDGSKLRIDLTYANAYYEGTLSGDGNVFDGDWHQGGGSLPLRLTRQ